MNITLIGGTWDNLGGRPSKIVAALAGALLRMPRTRVHCWNGGHLPDLQSFEQLVTDTEVLIWMPDVSNDVPEKILPTLKVRNPKMLLVSSKRVVERDYQVSDVIGRLLASHSNLGIMIDKSRESYRFRLLDPLGNLWADTIVVDDLAVKLWDRLALLTQITRAKSAWLGDGHPPVIELGFLEVVHTLGDAFAQHVTAVNPNRFLGNAATRCASGFPALRDGRRVYVTRRNVDKTGLSAADFVEVALHQNNDQSKTTVFYWGGAKPSVDTPIQLQLFEYFTHIRYLVHGHVYLEGAKTTGLPKLPCGALEEVTAIQRLVPKDVHIFSVNLRGHGCLLGTDNLEDLHLAFSGGLLSNFRARPMPEE